jgi:hypothetical protein
MNGRQDLQVVDGALLEKVIIKNDFSQLTPLEKVQHIKNVCRTLGLNPLTKPIQLISFKGKEVPYFTKDATEQLRKINNISLSITDTKMIDDVYVVIVEASTRDGRKDSATGSIVIGNLKGEDKANALMKAETKAKRRVTLSICGLGFIDESEADSIPLAKKIDPYVEPAIPKLEAIIDLDLKADLNRIACATSLNELQEAFTAASRFWAAKRDKVALKTIIEAKDKRKGEIDVEELSQDIDAATGEVK